MRPMSSWRIWLMLLDWTHRNKHSYQSYFVSSLVICVISLLVSSSNQAGARLRTSHCQKYFLDGNWSTHVLNTLNIIQCWHMMKHTQPWGLRRYIGLVGLRLGFRIWCGGRGDGRTIQLCLWNSVGPIFLNSSNSTYVCMYNHHTHTHIYIYSYICVCAVLACL